MLVLSRRMGESLKIGNEVTVLVLKVGGNQIQLGIDAPPAIPMHREEVWRRLALSVSTSLMEPLRKA